MEECEKGKSIAIDRLHREAFLLGPDVITKKEFIKRLASQGTKEYVFSSKGFREFVHGAWGSRPSRHFKSSVTVIRSIEMDTS